MATHTIAVAGKGGVGKTTICGMLIDRLSKEKEGPILVVDADANSNLNEVLGIEIETTLGAIREEMGQAELKGTIPPGITKQEYAETRFSQALTEEDDYDMLVMGRTQGKGCYCYVNGVLQSQMNKYVPNYRYVVIDNEAGLEHISRGILPHVDTMLLVSDCSRRGVQAVARIAEMVDELELKRPRRRTQCRGTGRNREARPAAGRGTAAGRAGLRVRLRGEAHLEAARGLARQDRASQHHGRPGVMRVPALILPVSNNRTR